MMLGSWAHSQDARLGEAVVLVVAIAVVATVDWTVVERVGKVVLLDGHGME